MREKRHPDDSENVAYVNWNGDRWVQNWNWLGDDWNGNVRVLRRKSFSSSPDTYRGSLLFLYSIFYIPNFKSKPRLATVFVFGYNNMDFTLI